MTTAFMKLENKTENYFFGDFLPPDLRKQLEAYNAANSNIPDEVIASIVIQVIVVAVGIGANLLVAVVTIFGNTRQHESSTITYVTNLSISSVVFLATVTFKLSEEIDLSWVHGQALCQITVFIKFLNFTLVVLFLMAMGVDRYIAVTRPISSGHVRSVRVSRIVSIVLWIFSSAAALPLALMHSADRDSRCSPKFPDAQASINLTDVFSQTTIAKNETLLCKYRSWSASFTTWTIANFIYSFFIPFVVIVICYSAIVHKIRSPSINSVRSSNPNSYNERVKRKVTQMSILLVISYTVCYVPYYLWQILRLVGVPVSEPAVCNRVQRFNETMAYINSALHPMFYIFTSGQFAKQYNLVKRKIGCGRAAYVKSQPSMISQHTKRTIVRSNGAAEDEEKKNKALKCPLIVDAKPNSAPMTTIIEKQDVSSTSM